MQPPTKMMNPRAGALSKFSGEKSCWRPRISRPGSASSLTFTIPASAEPPEVSAQRAAEGANLNMVISLSETLTENVTLNLVAGASNMATYGSSNDWHLTIEGTQCSAVTGTSCQATIMAG